MNARGIARPLIGKFCDRALGLRAPQRLGGHAQLAHAVAFDAVIVRRPSRCSCDADRAEQRLAARALAVSFGSKPSTFPPITGMTSPL